MGELLSPPKVLFPTSILISRWQGSCPARVLETWHWIVVLCLQPQPPKSRYQEGGCDALGQAKSRCWVWPGANVGGDLGQEQGLGWGDYPSGSGHPVLPSTLCLAWYLEDSGGGLGFCQSLWGQEPRGRKRMPGYQICPPGHLLSNNNDLFS